MSVRRSARHLMTAVALLLAVATVAGCVDMLTDREALTEASWYGRVTDSQNQGVSNAAVTLHVLNATGEVYERQAQAASSEPVRGVYAFEHIELRDGADRGYTTCNATVGNKTLTAVGQPRSLVDGARESTMNVQGKNITVITYGGVVDERLVLKRAG